MARPKLSYANVTSSLALFMALGGVGYAATALPANSVGTSQIKDKAVTGVKIADGTIPAGKLGPGSVGIGNLGPGAQLALKGATGNPGAKGETGAQGPKGDAGGLSDAFVIPARGVSLRLGTVSNCHRSGGGSTLVSCDGSTAGSELVPIGETALPAGNYLATFSYTPSDEATFAGISVNSSPTEGGPIEFGLPVACHIFDAGGTELVDLNSNAPSTPFQVVAANTAGRLKLGCEAPRIANGVFNYLGTVPPNGTAIEYTALNVQSTLIRVGELR